MIIAVELADPAAVAASEKGVLGELAAYVAPNYTAAQVYQGLADALAQRLADRGIAAQVTVVGQAPASPEPPSVTRDAIPILVGAGLAYLLLRKD
jgi:hypothetical protein